MLYVVEKNQLKNMVEQFIETDDEVITVFGKDGINTDDLPSTAGKLEDLIRLGELDDAVSFETLDYFIAKAILGSPGKQFREHLVKLAQKHNKVMFLVDPDYMVAVANRLIKESLNINDVSCLVEPIIDYTNESIRKATNQMCA